MDVYGAHKFSLSSPCMDQDSNADSARCLADLTKGTKGCKIGQSRGHFRRKSRVRILQGQNRSAAAPFRSINISKGNREGTAVVMGLIETISST